MRGWRRAVSGFVFYTIPLGISEGRACIEWNEEIRRHMAAGQEGGAAGWELRH